MELKLKLTMMMRHGELLSGGSAQVEVEVDLSYDGAVWGGNSRKTRSEELLRRRDMFLVACCTLISCSYRSVQLDKASL